MNSNNDQDQNRDDGHNKEIEKILEQHSNSLAGKVWRGSQNYSAKRRQQQTVSTGHKPLDKVLHSNGWPLAMTTEIGLKNPGAGELRLLIPALRKLSNSDLIHELKPKTSSKKSSQTHSKKILWIAPPFVPFAPSLVKEKIDLSKLTVVQTNNISDTLWATEQALLAECCAAVFCWTGTYNLSTHQMRRLQLAAEQSASWHVLLRHSDCLKQSSTAGLRLHIEANSYSKLKVHVLKQPQGWGGQRCTLSLHPHYENWQRLPVTLLPHHNNSQMPVLPEQVQTLSNSDHQQATVTVLSPVSAIKTVH